MALYNYAYYYYYYYYYYVALFVLLEPDECLCYSTGFLLMQQVTSSNLPLSSCKRWMVHSFTSLRWRHQTVYFGIDQNDVGNNFKVFVTNRGSLTCGKRKINNCYLTTDEKQCFWRTTWSMPHYMRQYVPFRRTSFARRSFSTASDLELTATCCVKLRLSLSLYFQIQT